MIVFMQVMKRVVAMFFEKKMNTVGTYYVCVRDQAGNVSERYKYKSITIDQIDDVPPTCVYGEESLHHGHLQIERLL